MNEITSRSTRFHLLAAIGLASVITLMGVRPASSETAGQISTRNIILGAVAVTTAVVLYNEYHHAAGTVVGVTADGGKVYIDGRIVFPDGTFVYLSNDGRRVCDFYGDEDRCGPRAHGFIWRYEGKSEWHGHGLHKGWYKEHGNPHSNEDNDSGHL